jgi:mannose-6-phosphate isomerase
MGVHGEGPSTTVLDGKTLKLGELIASDPAACLGEKTAGEFGNLPFLLKFLAAASPLSIQAHPSAEQARSGWERENRAGIDPASPRRNYRDPNHKPEIICALSPFTAMAGFRAPGETAALLSAFFAEAGLAAETTGNVLLNALEGGYRNFLDALFGLDEYGREIITGAALRASFAAVKTNTAAPGSKKKAGVGREAELCRLFAERYPGDPALLAPLYLNVLTLEPWEAIFIPAGMPHAYVHGFGVECMANSDNVLRGGLSPKHIDLQELFAVLDFEPRAPRILPRIEGQTAQTGTDGWERYAAPCREFTLYRLEHEGGKPGNMPAVLPATGAAIAASVKGDAALTLTSGNGTQVQTQTLTLHQGEAVFVPRRKAGESLAAAAVNAGDKTVLFAALAPDEDTRE